MAVKWTPNRTPAASPAQRRQRVLLAEDDPTMRHLLAEVLRDAGYEVVEARDGVALLNWIESTTWCSPEEAFDCVVSDIQMPDVTALEVMKVLRRTPWGTPIVLVSAYADDRTKAVAEQLGAVAVIDKPPDLKALRAAVERAVAVPQAS
jgi:CheY-like chemotaxis protein